MVKNNTEKEKKNNNILNNKLGHIRINLLKTKSKYLIFENFNKDLESILKSKQITMAQVNIIIYVLCKSKIFNKIYEKYKKYYLENLVNEKEDLNDINKYEFEIKSRDYAESKMIENIINITKNIYVKFNKISDQIIYEFISIITINKLYEDHDNFIEYLNKINFKTNNNKLCNLIYNKTEFDFFSILKEINLEKLLRSSCIRLNIYENLSYIINKYNLNDNKYIITDILIDMLGDNTYSLERNFDFKCYNIIDWIVENKEKDINFKLTLTQQIKLLGYSNLLIFINHIIYNYLFCEEYRDTKKFIDNLQDYLKNKYNDNVLKKNKLINNDKFTLKDFIETENKIEENYNYFINSVFLYTHDEGEEKIYKIRGYKIYDSDIKNMKKIVLYNFISFIKNNIEIENNIKLIYNLNLLNYNNNIFTYEEKLIFFKKIYNGKITATDIEFFILYHNQIAKFLIEKINLTENMVQLAFSCGNIDFIEKIIDMKYPITLKHLTYLQNCSEKQIINLLLYLNKYNIIDYLENLDWYYHIKFLCNNIDIPNIIYNDDNIELRNEFIIKVKELNNNNIIEKLNKINYIEFIDYCKTNKIKLSINDIIKLQDYNKRYYILNNFIH